MRNWIKFAVLVTSAFPAYVPGHTGAQVDDKHAEVFERGKQELFRGNYKEAIKLFEQAIEADKSKSNTAYRMQLARAYRYSSQDEKAVEVLQAIMRIAPDHVEAGQYLAEILAAGEKWKEIVDVLEPLLAYKRDYQTHHLLAEASYHLDKYKAARKYFEEAVRLNPSSGPDHYQLGNIHLSQNRFALAARSYENALRLGIESPILHYKLASAFFNLRNYFGRVSEVQIASGKVGTISGNYYLVEAVPGHSDRFRVAGSRSAIFHAARALAGTKEGAADIRMLVANIYLSARRYERAYAMYKKLGDSVPKDDRALYNYYFAQSAFGVEKYEEYIAHLKEAVALDKESYESALVDAYLSVADKNNQAGKLDKYIEYLSLAVQERPRNADLHLKLAHAHAEAKQYDQAVLQWRMVLDLEADHPQRTEILNLIARHRR